MGKGGEAKQQAEAIKLFSEAEVNAHSDWKRKDAWLVYRGSVYDISHFSKRHPGGNVISLYAGQDATTAIERFHKDEDKLDKWLKPLYIGKCQEMSKPDPITADFNKLTDDLTKEGMFKSNKLFYLGMLAHIILIEIAAWYYFYAGGLEWGGYLGYWGVALLLCTAQAQAGWLQHDFGHFSVFENYWLNYYAHQFTIAHLKAASKHWWQSRHHRHHAKPNVAYKDPDIDASLPMFLFGEVYFDSKKFFFNKTVLYQKYLWFLFGPPVVTTLLFVFQTIYYMFARKKWFDILWVLTYFIRLGYTFGPYLGFAGCVKLYFATRVIETQWFTWVTSMSHLPMPISSDKDAEKDWFSLQVTTTQNVHGGLFNDWFTGHLNYQIEHHLWPTMPRHNYYAVAPRVKALCEKHGLKYTSRGLFQAFCDIVHKLDVVAEHYDEFIEMKIPRKKEQ